MSPYKGKVHEALLKIKSKNSIIAGQKHTSPDLSLGKRVTLKSPPMHHGKFHQLSKPANSSHKNLLSIIIRPINPRKSPRETIFNISEGASNSILPNTLFNLLHHPSIPHNQNTTGSPSRRRVTPIHMLTPPQTSHYTAGNEFQFGLLQTNNIRLPLSKKIFDSQTLITLVSNLSHSKIAIWAS
jgi:hypothetical protein